MASVFEGAAGLCPRSAEHSGCAGQGESFTPELAKSGPKHDPERTDLWNTTKWRSMAGQCFGSRVSDRLRSDRLLSYIVRCGEGWNLGKTREPTMDTAHRLRLDLARWSSVLRSAESCGCLLRNWGGQRRRYFNWPRHPCLKGRWCNLGHSMYRSFC